MQACNDAYPIPGYILDIKNLMEAWKNASPQVKFSEFREIWVRLTMSYIHSARPDALRRAKWCSLLYETALGYLWISDFRIQIGALYTLYLLYMTQPKSGKYKIGVSVAIWREIFSILEKAENEKVPDVFAIVSQLHRGKCCCVFASVSIIPPPSSMPSKSAEDFSKKLSGKGNKLNLDTIGDDALNLEAILAADAAYKSHVGNETSIVAKDLVQELSNIKEAAALRIDQIEAVDSLPTSSMDATNGNNT